MKRIFICAERSFPRGDAGSNRVLYIAKAMQIKGWEPIVVSIGRNVESHYQAAEGKYYFDGVEYRNIVFNANGIGGKIERFTMAGKKTVDILKQYGLKNCDKVLIYSSSAIYTDSVLKYAKSVDAAVAVDIVEWHQPFQFPLGYFDLRYLSFKKMFNQSTKKANNVVVISRYLEKHFVETGCNVLTVPIYIEAGEKYTYHPSESVTHLIYPGNPYRKDSLECMLRAMELLSDEEKQKVKFHLTGVKREMLEKSAPACRHLLDEPYIQIDGYMEYDTLMKLYEQVDFALIARPDNQVTRANFPSKVPELMNRGIPVVINGIGDIKEYLVDRHNAILIQEPTIEETANALRIALNCDAEMRKAMHDHAFESAKAMDYRKAGERLDQFFSNMR